jgi:Secretion system C-terminal sorting domain
MKLLYIFLFISFGSTAFAQLYTGFKGNSVHFYTTPGNNKYVCAKIDSSVFDGTDSIHFIEREFRTLMTPLVDTNCTFWGPGCTKLKDIARVTGKTVAVHDNFMRVVTGLDDTLNFDLLMLSGDSSLVYSDPGQEVWLKFNIADTMTVFGNLDSVRNFRFLHYDNVGTVIPGTIHNSLVDFSKTYGMLNGFALDSFPVIVKPMTLSGMRGPNVGFYGLSHADVYDYQVGAVMEGYDPSSPYPGYDYYRLEILSRTDFPDSVAYSIKRIDQLNTWSGTAFYYVYDTNIISGGYSKKRFIDDHLSWGHYWFGMGSYYIDTNAMSCNYTSNAYEVTGSQCYGPCINDPFCYGDFDCGVPVAYYTQYMFKAGFGNINRELLYPTFPPFSDYSSIYYVQNGTINCGSEMVSITEDKIFDNSILIYPNPASSTISVDNSASQIEVSSIEIRDVVGKIIFSASSVFGKGKSDIQVSEFENGTYFVVIKAKAGGGLIKKIIINN